jgi:hypothetical protein
LKFKRYSGHITAAPILTITNNTAQKVTLDGLRLLDVKDGLALAGNGPIEIVNSTVAGAQGKEGTCVAVRSQGAKIVHSDISACLEGVRIEAGDALLGAADAAHWAEEKNTIHHNGTGIRVVSGGRNRFGYNSIFGNYVLGQTSGRDNGIKIEQTATVEVLRPKVIFDEASGAAIRCTRLPDGKIAKREIWFKPEATGGEVQVFRTSASDFMQGKTFFASCSLAQDGKCELGNWQIDISELQKVCWPDEFAVAMLYTGTSSSMYADVPISLAGVFSTPAPPLYEMPTPSGARPDDERPKLPLESGEVVPVPGPGGTDPDASAEPQGRKAGFALPSPNCTLLKD